jgi:hypothetical protein
MLEDEDRMILQTLTTTYTKTRRHIRENMKFPQHRWENLKRHLKDSVP